MPSKLAAACSRSALASNSPMPGQFLVQLDNSLLVRTAPSITETTGMTDNSNKTALVTGASRSIGRATARALADAGTRVVIHYGSGIRSSGARRSVLFNKSSAALLYALAAV